MYPPGTNTRTNSVAVPFPIGYLLSPEIQPSQSSLAAMMVMKFLSNLYAIGIWSNRLAIISLSRVISVWPKFLHFHIIYLSFWKNNYRASYFPYIFQFGKMINKVPAAPMYYQFVKSGHLCGRYTSSWGLRTLSTLCIGFLETTHWEYKHNARLYFLQRLSQSSR